MTDGTAEERAAGADPAPALSVPSPDPFGLFSFPAGPHRRRHGPAGYADYESYRPWLRDEFEFRCVNCLTRECWRGRSYFVIDHFVAQTIAPERAAEYNNLVYSCVRCNLAKGERSGVLDPCADDFSRLFVLSHDGRLTGITPEAVAHIELLDLNCPEQTDFRKRQLSLRAALERLGDDAVIADWFGYPDDLPDLSRLRPLRNSRPAGLQSSYLERRRRGELPAAY